MAGCAALLAVSHLAGCADHEETIESFVAGLEPAELRSVPADLVQLAVGDLLANGSFTQGDSGWLQSTRRDEVGNPEKIIGPLPAGVPLPPNGLTTVARLCGYATSAVSSTGSTRITCNDLLRTADNAPIVVPKGSTSLSLSFATFARYGCQGDFSADNPGGHGPLTVILRPVDGLPAPKPTFFSAKEAVLPEGSWRRIPLTISDIPNLADQDRRFQLALRFETGLQCRSPNDESTFVLVTDLNARAN